MSDRYLAFVNSNFGRRLAGSLGLPAPVRLERWMAGRARPVDGALLLGGDGEGWDLLLGSIELGLTGTRRLIE